MASALKRKRGPVEAAVTPKRVKSVEESQEYPTPKFSHSGWDAAFTPATNTQKLVNTNGINGCDARSEEEGSPEAVDFADYAKLEQESETSEERAHQEGKAAAEIFYNPSID